MTGTDLVPASSRDIASSDDGKIAHVERSEPVKDYVTPAPFVVYGADGEILTAGRQGVAYTTDAMARGERILFAEIPWNNGLADLGNYVDVANRTVLEKTACPARLDGLTLTDLPVPCCIEIGNPDGPPSVYAWGEPALVLRFDHPGTYPVRVLSVPHWPATSRRQSMPEPKTLHHATGYREHRASAYPETGQALDALAKGLAAYHRGEPLPPDTLDYLQARADVKARFPKPEPDAE